MQAFVRAPAHTRASTPHHSTLSRLQTTHLRPNALSNHLQLRRTVTTDTSSKRTAVPVGGGFFFKALIFGGGGFAYVIYNYFKRSAAKQRKYIKQRFLEPPNLAVTEPWLVRPVHEKLFSQYFKLPPAGPIVVTGGDGSGKSSILKKVISSRPMTMYLDLRENPVTSEDEFMYQFVQQSGYLLPSTEFLARWLLKEKAPKERRIAKIEVDNALTCLQSVFLAEKKAGWQNGIPVLWINGMEGLQSGGGAGGAGGGGGGGGKKGDKEKYDARYELDMSKFLNFCVYVSDNRLAHVVLSTTRDFSRNFLDKHSAWRLRREVMHINYPEPSEITQYLKTSVNEYLKEHECQPMADEEIDYISKCIGGCMTDIAKVVTSVMRGHNAFETVDRLVTDSVIEVAKTLEATLEEANSASAKDKSLEKASWEKYLRFWNLMKLLTERGSVSRSELIHTLFKDQPSELDTYESTIMISYVWRQTFDSPIKHFINHVKQEVAGGKGEDVALPVQGDLTAPATAMLSGDTTNTVTVDDPVKRVEQRLDAVEVVPGIPRMRIAFQSVLNDARMKEQAERVEKNLKKKDLKSDKKDYTEELEKLLVRKANLVDEQQKFLESSDRFKELYGEQEFQNRKQRIPEDFAKVQQEVDKLMAKLDKASSDLDTIADKGKAKQTAIVAPQ